MSTTVFQELQTCLDPQMMETRTLRLKLSSPNPGSGSWNITQSLSNSPKTPKQIEPSYIHPLTKNLSYSKLSDRSLDLCTENLGCETGTDMIEDTLFSLSSRETNGGEKNEREQFSPQYSDIRKNNYRNFPPPLTTRSGSNALEVRPVREGGRLVIQAVEAPSSHGCFQTERSNGRLKLSLFRDPENYEIEMDSNEKCENEVEDLENEVNSEKEENVFEEMDAEEKFEKHKEYEVNSEFLVNEVMKGNYEDLRGKMGIRMFPRPMWCENGRCSKGLCNWEPLWVATS